ncbi:helix-turn-helix domain-containing protein [Streptococcus pneumoniae]|uniref:Helix-turn-helix domain-containing protein n=3 Tax=Bacteria TaxID=2 RepID=A0A6G2DJ53_STREE|nr:helix-turn-helix domain-containing protein [Streptococcus pneumoniae]MDA5264169.1 helix-turn-helix domain-containing protein [Streptococcus pneumoniae]MTV89757.1 helix-turn-helix domain-containing protein [Streptococcus pneumoniae]NMG97092.1 helix-turn-helix domain-containing protein [Streptococcus pneumoniae]OZS34122.1 helix-turn-helix domain-containing protein [Streptococcus pneumoniae]
MTSMRKKTIGEVLRLARINQGLSLDELQKKTEIQLDMLEAMEADDFDQLPSPFYTRSFLKKYAWAVELDDQIVLDAYDSGSMITYEEVDVDEDELTGRRRSSKKKKKKTSFLPLFYFILFALSILIFVTYYVWNYIQTQPEEPSLSNYSVVQSTSSTSSVPHSSSSSSSSIESAISVSGEGNHVEIAYKTSKETVKLQLAVSDVTSWVSVSESELEGGVTLSPKKKSAEATVATKSPVTITLGVVKGVTLTVDNQTVDLSKLTAQTGQITVTFTKN